MSDLVGNHIVGFPTRRLIWRSAFQILYKTIRYDGLEFNQSEAEYGGQNNTRAVTLFKLGLKDTS